MPLPPLERAVFEAVGDAYRYIWPVTGAQVEFERFHDGKEGLVAEATVALFTPGQPPRLLHDTRMNLSSTQHRAAVVRHLERVKSDVDWAMVVEQACFMAKRQFREGEPAVDLFDVDTSGRPRWLLRPYVEHGGPTVIFGPGGSTKTYFLAAAAVSLASGKAVVGMPVGQPRTVVIYDWETDRYAHAERVRAICAGAGIGVPLPARIYYRSMTGPLAEAAPYLRRETDRLGAEVAMYDSLGMACGGELESAESILRCFTGARIVGKPAVFASHVTKAAMRGEGENSGRRISPFGSVYTENAARNTWSLEWAGEEGEDEGAVALVNQKTNNGQYQKRHAYRVRFVNSAEDETGESQVTAVEYRRCELSEIAAFQKQQSLADQLLQSLLRGAKTPKDAAEEIGAPADQARSRLREMASRGKVIQLPDKRYAAASSY